MVKKKAGKRKRDRPERNSEELGYACCFCGKAIQPIPPDIIVLSLRTRLQDLEKGKKTDWRELYCHAACLKARVPNMNWTAELDDE